MNQSKPNDRLSTYHYYKIIYADYDFSNSARSKSSFEIQLIISVNVTEAKLFFALTGFEPRTSGSSIQHPNHYTTEALNRAVSHYKYDIGYRCKVLYMLTLVEHLSLL